MLPSAYLFDPARNPAVDELPLVVSGMLIIRIWHLTLEKTLDVATSTSLTEASVAIYYQLSTVMHSQITTRVFSEWVRASEKPFFDKFVRLMVRPSMGLFVRKYRYVPQIVPEHKKLIISLFSSWRKRDWKTYLIEEFRWRNVSIYNMFRFSIRHEKKRGY